MRTLAEHRSQYDPDAARRRLEAEAKQPVYRPRPKRTVEHVHRYSELTFTCRCGRHGRAW